MSLFLSARVREKLLARNITEAHVVQCFANRAGRDLFDNRPKHKTDPPTRWFIAETDYGIKLKVCFIYHQDTQLVEIKSAFKPNDEEVAIYAKHG